MEWQACLHWYVCILHQPSLHVYFRALAYERFKSCIQRECADNSRHHSIGVVVSILISIMWLIRAAIRMSVQKAVLGVRQSVTTTLATSSCILSLPIKDVAPRYQSNPLTQMTVTSLAAVSNSPLLFVASQILDDEQRKQQQQHEKQHAGESDEDGDGDEDGEKWCIVEQYERVRRPTKTLPDAGKLVLKTSSGRMVGTIVRLEIIAATAATTSSSSSSSSSSVQMIALRADGTALILSNETRHSLAGGDSFQIRVIFKIAAPSPTLGGGGVHMMYSSVALIDDGTITLCRSDGYIFTVTLPSFRCTSNIQLPILEEAASTVPTKSSSAAAASVLAAVTEEGGSRNAGNALADEPITAELLQSLKPCKEFVAKAPGVCLYLLLHSLCLS